VQRCDGREREREREKKNLFLSTHSRGKRRLTAAVLEKIRDRMTSPQKKQRSSIRPLIDSGEMHHHNSSNLKPLFEYSSTGLLATGAGLFAMSIRPNLISSDPIQRGRPPDHVAQYLQLNVTHVDRCDVTQNIGFRSRVNQNRFASESAATRYRV
jgi:hypothetical protein